MGLVLHLYTQHRRQALKVTSELRALELDNTKLQAQVKVTAMLHHCLGSTWQDKGRVTPRLLLRADKFTFLLFKDFPLSSHHQSRNGGHVVQNISFNQAEDKSFGNPNLVQGTGVTLR